MKPQRHTQPSGEAPGVKRFTPKNTMQQNRLRLKTEPVLLLSDHTQRAFQFAAKRPKLFQRISAQQG